MKIIVMLFLSAAVSLAAVAPAFASTRATSAVPGPAGGAGLRPDDPVDTLIIGGGPGGLGVAAGLARMRHTAHVFDSGVYRNAKVTHMHNVLGWDHADPSDFRRKVRHDLVSRYDGISFVDTTITDVRKLESGNFEARDSGGKTYYGRKLALAHGVRDVMPNVAGYRECWPQGM